MLDFSKIDELRPLARLVARIDSLCPGSTFLIAGAQARDLLLEYGYDIDTEGKLDLIGDMRLEFDDGIRLMSALRDGFNRLPRGR